MEQSRVRWRVGVVDALCPGRDQEKEEEEEENHIMSEKHSNKIEAVNINRGFVWFSNIQHYHNVTARVA